MARYGTNPVQQSIDSVPVVPLDPDVTRILRRLLIKLANEQDAAAAKEAAQVPYWKPCPLSVIGIRAAARVLRDAAEALPSATHRAAV